MKGKIKINDVSIKKRFLLYVLIEIVIFCISIIVLFSKNYDFLFLGLFGIVIMGVEISTTLNTVDLTISENTIILTYLFSIKEVILNSIQITDVQIYRGPCFTLFLNNSQNMICSFTKKNYHIIIKILNNNTLYSQDQFIALVKKSFFQPE